MRRNHPGKNGRAHSPHGVPESGSCDVNPTAGTPSGGEVNLIPHGMRRNHPGKNGRAHSPHGVPDLVYVTSIRRRARHRAER